ncbi:hypothetical protein Sjap_008357 [Stephania japonica]|uniref:Ubiquitin-like protease family profile domain-containing protein n=1 Tax=Stephania japonica TaxID=461633 RepID=A0AAP0JQX8_9MAGN
MNLKHLDVGTWWLRKKMTKESNHKPCVAILDTMFSSMLYKQGSKITIDNTLLSHMDGCFYSQNSSISFKEADKIAFTLNVRNRHWIALDCDINDHVICVLDSMMSSRRHWEKEIEYFSSTIDKMLIECGREVPNNERKIIIPKIPQQMG